MMANAGNIVSRERLLSGVRRTASDPGTNPVEVYMRHPRRKLEDDEGMAIETVRGFGYPVPLG